MVIAVHDGMTVKKVAPKQERYHYPVSWKFRIVVVLIINNVPIHAFVVKHYEEGSAGRLSLPHATWRQADF